MPATASDLKAIRRLLREITNRVPSIGSFPIEKALLTIEQTAAALEMSSRTLRYWTSPQRRPPLLEPVRIGKAVRFEIADVLRLIEERKFRRAA